MQCLSVLNLEQADNHTEVVQRDTGIPSLRNLWRESVSS